MSNWTAFNSDRALRCEDCGWKGRGALTGRKGQRLRDRRCPSCKKGRVRLASYTPGKAKAAARKARATVETRGGRARL